MTNIASGTMRAAGAGLAVMSARRHWQWTLALLGFSLVAMLAVHGQTVYGAVSIWNRSQTYLFAWAVVPTLAYLLWHNRERLAPLAPRGSVFGVVAAAVCAAAWLAGDLLNIAEARQLALAAAIGAVVLAAVGWPVFRVLLPFLFLLVFLVPTGGILVTPLKHLSITLVGVYASLAGLPFATEGFAFFIGAQRYVVIDDCAALPYLLVGSFVGLSLALLIYRRWWKIAALTLFAGGLSLLANAVRIGGIITYDYITGSELTLSQHEYFEWFATALNFLVLFTVFARLTPDGAVKVAPSGPAPMIRIVAPVLLAASLVAVVPLIGGEPSPSPMNEAAVKPLPANLSGWARQDTTPDWQAGTRDAVGYALLSDYARGGRRITVFVLQPKLRRDKVSGGRVDLIGDATRWMPSSREQITLCTADRCHDILYLRHLLRDSDRVRHVYSVLATGADMTTSVLQFRFRRAWARLTGAPSRARLIAIATENVGGLSQDEIAAILGALTQPPPRT